MDVGADHGRIARAIGAIATERLPHRIAGPGPYVVADGLKPFKNVNTVVVAGMGALRIAAILEGHRPACAVLHAQDDPIVLRRWLARNGWSIVRERLAPEARGFAELIHAEPGDEPSQGAALDLGPQLLDDPLLEACWRQRHRSDQRIRGVTRPEAEARMRHVEATFAARGWHL